MQPLIFPLGDFYWFYVAFISLILVLLAVDLAIFNREDHEVTFAAALKMTIGWIALALTFNLFLFFYVLFNANELANPLGLPAQHLAIEVALEFLAGFIIEKSLAFDNLFVFYVLFNFFGVPKEYQHRVLFYGILGALVFRAIIIAIGSVLVQYPLATILFGLFLVYTGIKIVFSGNDILEPEKNWLLVFLRRVLPISKDLHGHSFFVRQDNKLYATPLFVALIFIEFSDIVFAVDSVPAVFALTREPLIVFTSNIFAILGLRAMYFMLLSIVDKFHLLRFGLGAVLVFVGVKMAWLNEHSHGAFPTWLSLLIITFCIGGSIGASLIWPAPKEVALKDTTHDDQEVRREHID